MSNSSPTITSVHLCGSIPGSNTREVIETVTKVLPNRLKRIPDGETGERYYFVRWQIRAIAAKNPTIINPQIKALRGFEDGKTSWTEEEKKTIFQEIVDSGGYETKYDEAALASYQEFVKLREEGVVPQGARFMVGLPTPLTVATAFIDDAFLALFEEVYEAAMMRALKRIQAEIPKHDLAIQWDVPMEFTILEKAPVANQGAKEAWWEGSPLEGITDRLARLVDTIDDGVEAGLHLCYGNFENKHFVEPKDMGWMVTVAEEVLDKAKRKLQWIHMPVPIERSDDEYFEPLPSLVSKMGDTELSLGLVHVDDLEGTKKRIETAGRFAKAFSLSSECGFGRQSQEAMKSALEISAQLCPQIK